MNYKILALVFLSFLLIMEGQEAKQSIDNQEILKYQTKLSELSRSYGSLLDKALFTIEETRPFCIIQFPQVFKKYDQNWISPDYILSIISDEQKDSLTVLVSNYLSSMDKSRSSQILFKLRDCCNVLYEMSFISEKLGFTGDMEIHALLNIPDVKPAIEMSKEQNVERIGMNKTGDKDETYYTAINFLCSQNRENQMKYYSELFQQLSLLSKK